MDFKDSDKGIFKGCLIDRVDESQVDKGDYIIVFTYRQRPMTLHKKLSEAEQFELAQLKEGKLLADLEWHKEEGVKGWFFDRVIQSEQASYLTPKNLDDVPAVPGAPTSDRRTRSSGSRGCVAADNGNMGCAVGLDTVIFFFSSVIFDLYTLSTYIFYR